MPARLSFIVRHRRAVTWVALVFLALLFAIHVFHWHAPYRLGGAVGEWPLLAVALAVGVAARFGLPATFARFRGGAALPAAAVASVLAFLVAQAADPFARGRDWRYGPEDCDFAVSFPRRAETMTAPVRLGAQPDKSVTRAVLIDLGRALTLSAECLPLAGAIADADLPAVLDAAEALLRQSAARLRLKIETVARPDARTVVLKGFSDEGRNAVNETLLRRAEAHAVAGPSSLLVVWAWAVGREGEPPTDFAGFFAAIRVVERRAAKP